MSSSISRSESLLQKVSKIRDIPTLSVVLGGVLKALREEDTPRHKIAELLKRDQILTARILRMVNSGFYARSVEITDVKRALHFLGDHTVMALVLGTSSFNDEDHSASSWFDVQDFWLHCLATAVASEFLAIRLGGANPEECFTCGLLHDLGKMALFRADKETLEEIVLKCRKEGRSFLSAENELGLPGHHVVGERIAQQWSLPVVVRKTIRYHHKDVRIFESIVPEHRKVVMIVTLADTMAKRCGLGFSGDELLPDYNEEYLAALGISRTFIEELEERLPMETFSARELLVQRNLQKKIA
ncbi:MAG: HDOD domain-containing protein [Bdellovibrionota bacterium]